jgi:hypothetical protein
LRTHQTAPVLVDLVGERLDVGGDLGLQRRREHLSCAVADDLVEQRRIGRVLVGRLGVVDYLERGRTSRAGAPRPTRSELAIGFDLAREAHPLQVTPPRAIHRF